MKPSAQQAGGAERAESTMACRPWARTKVLARKREQRLPCGATASLGRERQLWVETREELLYKNPAWVGRTRIESHRASERKHLTPFLLNGYPCLLCPCVVCFKFLQPKVIEGKKIDCALADPHLPRLLGGAPQLFTTNLVPPLLE